MSKTFFTADTHFSHSNILKYSKRPFKNVTEMNEKLVENWNSKISNKDEVWHLGDFCFDEKGQGILDQLNGHKHLIKGNHEKVGKKLKGWASISDYKELYVGEQFIVLSHYAMRVWNKSHYGAWMLYGHSHGTLEDNIYSLSFDVGVDCHNYVPLEFEDVKQIISKKKWEKPF